uniref:Uncharacterized protein n=1 Tax=Arundo donax TaxID=35708 RepID=A0A0A9ELC1_ARUDO
MPQRPSGSRRGWSTWGQSRRGRGAEWRRGGDRPRLVWKGWFGG